MTLNAEPATTDLSVLTEQARARQDPFPVFHALRARGPVVAVDVPRLLGQPELGEGRPKMTTLSFEATRKILVDSTTFSSTAYAATHRAVVGRTVLSIDPPEHDSLRALVSAGFRPRTIQHWGDVLIPSILDALLDELAERGPGPVDLVEALTRRFPIQVIAAILGLPRSDWPWFFERAVEKTEGMANGDYDLARRAQEQLGEYFQAVVADRRARPADDVVSELAAAEWEGQRLSDEDIFSFLSILLTAGAETTYKNFGSLLLALLTNPDQLEELRADRDLVGPTVDEALRWESPVAFLQRVALRDSVVEGVPIPEGTFVHIGISAANHDPDRWPDPERFDIHRPPQQSLVFGAGVHLCLGMHLARLELRLGLEAMLDRFPALRLPDDAGTPRVVGMSLRGPATLPALLI